MKKMKFTDFLLEVFLRHLMFVAALLVIVVAGAYLFFDVNVIKLIMELWGL